jgi:hypothetical protein
MDRAEDEQALWDAYNLLLTGPDLERLRKMIARYELFRLTLEVPGDVVEAGVFKGAGLLYFLKLLAIHCPGSAKRVVGFDLFADFEAAAPESERASVRALTAAANTRGTDIAQIEALARRAGFGADRCVLVKGDIAASARELCRREPGFRISLLHLDLDLGGATQAALEVLWDRVVRGGVVVFDEYAIPMWSASEGIDAFLAQRDVRIRSLPYGRTPGGYVVKP